jgi:hypothetical protein
LQHFIATIVEPDLIVELDLARSIKSLQTHLPLINLYPVMVPIDA